MARTRECKLPWEAAPYLCGTIAKPLRGATKTGFVNLVFVQNNNFVVITMGNKSSPYFNNKLYCKNFTLGGSTAQTAEVTIVDTSGNDLSVFFDAVWAAKKPPKKQIFCYVEFGWIITDCDGKNYVYSTASVTRTPYFMMPKKGGKGNPKRTPSGFLKFNIQEVDVSDSSSGAWEYKLKLNMLADMLSIEKSPVPIGRSEHKVPLKQAAPQAVVAPVNAALQNAGIGDRQEADALFVRFVPPGQIGNSTGIFQEYSFPASDGGAYGPSSIWDANRTNPLFALRQWCSSLATDRNLGMTFFSDPTLENANVVVLETPENILCGNNQNPFCKANDPNLKAITGKAVVNRNPKYIYLVNAGDCSPVIDFKPNYKFVPQSKASVKGKNNIGKGTVKQQFCDPKNAGQNAGVRAQVTLPNNNLNFRAPKNAMDAEANAFNLNIRSDGAKLVQTGFEATLDIEGNPEFTSITGCVGLPIGIVYFNRAAVTSINKNKNQSCEWLANPAVNRVMSSTNYFLSGASHRINDDGTFVTTLKLKLNIQN